MSAVLERAAPASGRTREPASDGKVSDVRRLLEVVVVAAAGSVAGLTMARIFTLGEVIVPVLVTAIVAAALSYALARSRVSAGWVLLASPIAFIEVATITALRDTAIAGAIPSGDTLSALRDGTVDGWARILTTSVPADPRPELVFVAALLTWAGTALACGILLRTTRPMLALLPAAAATTAAWLLAVPGTGSAVAPGLALGACGVALAILTGSASSTRRLNTDEARAKLVRSGVFGVVVFVVAAVVWTHLPLADEESFDPRDDRAPPVEVLDAINPLAQLAGWATRPKQTMFETDTREPTEWRLAVFEDFDGRTWSAPSEMQPSGAHLPPSPTPGERGDEVTADVHLGALGGVWLPTPGRADRLSGIDVYVDPATGVVASRTGAVSGDYRVTAAREGADFDSGTALATATLPASVPPELLAAPGIETNEAGKDLADKAREVTLSAQTPMYRALKLEEYIRNSGVFDPKGPSGHSYVVLRNIVMVADPGRGTSEQFATAFAVMARAVGIPTRVVVGFRDGGGRGVHPVHSGDAYAWPEILLDGYGWVPMAPTPPDRNNPPPKEEQQKAKEDQDKKDQIIDLGPRPAADPPQLPPESGSGTNVLLAVATAVAALLVVGLLLVLLTVVLRRRRRGRRRRSPDPAQRIEGAWLETCDTLRTVGLPRRPSMTATDYAHEASRVDAVGEPMHGLADLTNRARYGVVAPPPDQADLAWTHADAVAKAVTRATPFIRRLRAAIDPRPLLARNR